MLGDELRSLETEIQVLESFRRTVKVKRMLKIEGRRGGGAEMPKGLGLYVGKRHSLAAVSRLCVIAEFIPPWTIKAEHRGPDRGRTLRDPLDGTSRQQGDLWTSTTMKRDSPSGLKRTRLREGQSLLREENGEGREWWYVVEGEENDKGNNQRQVGWQKRVARPGERGKSKQGTFAELNTE